MILKTIEDEATKSGKAVTFLGKKISNIRRDLKDHKGIINSFFKSSENFGLSDEQVKLLEEWNRKAKVTGITQQELTEITKNADKATQEYFKGLNGKEATLEGLAKATQKVGVGAKAAEVGVKALNFAINSLIAIGVSLVINVIISRFNELVNAFQNGLDKLKDLSSEINGLKSEIKSLESELSETKIKIDELEKLPKLTFLQKEELEELRKFNDELERQRKIKEAQIEVDKAEQNRTAQALWMSTKSFINWDVKPVDEWEWHDWLGNFGTRNNPLERLANLIQGNLFSTQLKDLEDYERKLKELNEIKESAD